MRHPSIDLYIDLLIRAISNTIYADAPIPFRRKLREDPNTVTTFDPLARALGLDWPSQAHSMSGVTRLTKLASQVQELLETGVPGDFIETGVWRGGSCILMRGVLNAHGVTDRRVWVCDSFEGLPRPDATAFPADKGARFHKMDPLAIPVEQVQANFAAYDLLDDQVRFVKGFFRDTLPQLDAGPFALIRLDGDMYESTIQALDALYHRLSPGGIVIIDDMALLACAQAVSDFRGRHDITAPIEWIDTIAAWWRKPLA